MRNILAQYIFAYDKYIFNDATSLYGFIWFLYVCAHTRNAYLSPFHRIYRDLGTSYNNSGNIRTYMRIHRNNLK